MNVKEFLDDEASNIKAHKGGWATIVAYMCEGVNVKSVGDGMAAKKFLDDEGSTIKDNKHGWAIIVA